MKTKQMVRKESGSSYFFFAVDNSNEGFVFQDQNNRNYAATISRNGSACLNNLFGAIHAILCSLSPFSFNVYPPNSNVQMQSVCAP
jgi:hypothetical protein